MGRIEIGKAAEHLPKYPLVNYGPNHEEQDGYIVRGEERIRVEERFVLGYTEGLKPIEDIAPFHFTETVVKCPDGSATTQYKLEYRVPGKKQSFVVEDGEIGELKGFDENLNPRAQKKEAQRLIDGFLQCSLYSPLGPQAGPSNGNGKKPRPLG